MKYLNHLALLLILFGSSCSNRNKTPVNPNTNDPQDPPGPVISLSSYPLTVGNMWIYDNGDTIRAVADTVINGVIATKMKKTNGAYTALFFLANTADGSYVVASNWKPAFEQITGPLYKDFNAGPDLVIPNPSVLFAKYPVDTVQEWNAHVPTYEHFWRQWDTYFTVTTPAGKFNCIRMHTGVLDEYYSSKGLVKTVQHVQCIVAPCPVFVTKLIYANF